MVDVPCRAKDNGININLRRRDRLPELEFRAFLPRLNSIQIHPRRRRHRKLTPASAFLRIPKPEEQTHKPSIRAPIHIYDFPSASTDLLRDVRDDNLERREGENADAGEGTVVVCCCDR